MQWFSKFLVYLLSRFNEIFCKLWASYILLSRVLLIPILPTLPKYYRYIDSPAFKTILGSAAAVGTFMFMIYLFHVSFFIVFYCFLCVLYLVYFFYIFFFLYLYFFLSCYYCVMCCVPQRPNKLFSFFISFFLSFFLSLFLSFSLSLFLSYYHKSKSL